MRAGRANNGKYQFESKCGKWYYAVVAVISGDLVVLTDIRSGGRAMVAVWDKRALPRGTSILGPIAHDRSR